MKNMLIYYGWLNSFNSATNGWDNKKVSEELARYDILVLGDGVAATSHGDYSNTSVIIPRIQDLHEACKIFGYASVNQSYSNFCTKVDEWDDLDIDGIFFDEAGYDYGSTSTNGRSAFNDKVDYVHSKGMYCFINAWKDEHIYGTNSDASYPDSTWNPDGLACNLLIDDWYLLESFAVTSAAAYESAVQWKSRGERAKALPFNIAGCSCISDSDSNGLDKWDFIETSALMFSLDAVGSSDSLYGASSAKSKMWSRLDKSKLGCKWKAVNEVVQSDVDADVYVQYLEGAQLKLDFSSSAEDSEIVIY